ncbi:hypothetical protein NMG60_11005288 [Bertholletia excelsa]
MKYIALLRTIHRGGSLPKIVGPLQSQSFQLDFAPGYPKTKPKKYRYPAFYDPYGPRPPPFLKIIQPTRCFAALPTKEGIQIGPILRKRLRHPNMLSISVEGMGLGLQGEPSSLENFDAVAKIKVIKEVKAFTNLGLKEAKHLVDKLPVVFKQGVNKVEANDITKKIKGVGGVTVIK